MKKSGVKTTIIATITPLASIFGSGFLVIVPILAGAVGAYSPLVMAIVCAVAYSVGSVIRFNIKHAEPLLLNKPSESTLSFERGSDLALILAYIISVSLYLHILSAFVLGGLNIDTPFAENLLTSIVLAFITIVGFIKGLKALRRLETWSLSITLFIILAIIMGFSAYGWQAWTEGNLVIPSAVKHTPWEILTIVSGTLIVVQGFETPRYLGETYEANTRIAASRWSQIISTVVYLIFVTLSLPLLHTLNNQYDDNSLIRLVGAASSLLVTPLIMAAALSQFSAAVADTLTATGNLEEITHHGLRARWGYLFVGCGAIALTWSADTYQILALASRAFAFYYLLQCFVAFTVSKSSMVRIGLILIAIVLGFITVFAVPAG